MMTIILYYNNNTEHGVLYLYNIQHLAAYVRKPASPASRLAFLLYCINIEVTAYATTIEEPVTS